MYHISNTDKLHKGASIKEDPCSSMSQTEFIWLAVKVYRMQHNKTKNTRKLLKGLHQC